MRRQPCVACAGVVLKHPVLLVDIVVHGVIFGKLCVDQHALGDRVADKFNGAAGIFSDRYRVIGVHAEKADFAVERGVPAAVSFGTAFIDDAADMSALVGGDDTEVVVNGCLGHHAAVHLHPQVKIGRFVCADVKACHRHSALKGKFQVGTGGRGDRLGFACRVPATGQAD